MKAIITINDNKVIADFDGSIFAAVYANHKEALYNGFSIMLHYAQNVKTELIIQVDN